MSPRDLVYVGHMLDMARKAVTKTAGLSRKAYDADENLRLALIHLIQIIGEAGRQVSPEFWDSKTLPDIENKELKAFSLPLDVLDPPKSPGRDTY
jgi:uncharacterized protein with HEPN domain